MCMSEMERRLQLLLDQQRYALVEREATRSGRSVSAVIREAIDFRFDNEVSARMAAGEWLLAHSSQVTGREPDWAETKALLGAGLKGLDDEPLEPSRPGSRP
jgi:Ribbon-helix-helix protein, copG family